MWMRAHKGAVIEQGVGNAGKQFPNKHIAVLLRKGMNVEYMPQRSKSSGKCLFYVSLGNNIYRKLKLSIKLHRKKAFTAGFPDCWKLPHTTLKIIQMSTDLILK